MMIKVTLWFSSTVRSKTETPTTTLSFVQIGKEKKADADNSFDELG